MGRIGLLASDLIISFMWVWSGVLIKIYVFGILGFGHGPGGEIIKCALSIVNMFFFALLGKVTNGGTYNPLTVLSGAITGDFSRFLFTVGARIPAQVVLCYINLSPPPPYDGLVPIVAAWWGRYFFFQSDLFEDPKKEPNVIGSIAGVWLIIAAFPEVGHGPRLNVDLHRGALTEGLLTFAIVTVSLGLARKIPGSFFRKTWISSVSKLTLHILGSDLTGGCMNPASVMGWAYARGDHFTKEHIMVYWLAPIEATLLAIWTFRVVVPPVQEDKVDMKAKSE